MEAKDFENCGLKPGHALRLQAVITCLQRGILAVSTPSTVETALASVSGMQSPISKQSRFSGFTGVDGTNEDKKPDCEHTVNSPCTLKGKSCQEPPSNGTLKSEVNIQKDNSNQVSTDTHAHIQRLRTLCESLRDEITVLQECLVENHLLGIATVSIKLHKNKFAKVKESTGWSGDVCLGDAMKSTELTSLMVRFAGPGALSTYRATSSAAHALIDAVSMKLYVFGGNSSQAWKSVERFDPQRNCWERLLDMQVGRSSSAAAVVDGQVYVCGGYGPLSNVVQRMRRNGLGWDTLKSMDFGRLDHAATGFKGCLYIAGGDVGESVSRSAQRLVLSNPTDKGTWETLPPMLEHRALFQMVSWSGQLFVSGGREDERLPKASEHCHHPEAPDEASWALAPAMLMPREGHAAVALGGKVLVSGGFGWDGITWPASGTVYSSTECFDIRTNSWTSMPPMLGPRVVHGSACIAGKVFVRGGKREPWWSPDSVEVPVDSVEQFDPLTGEWRELPPMLFERMHHIVFASAFELIVS